MGDDNNVSRYVKLTKDNDAPVEEIRPGELNQPVQVPQLVVHRCRECGQALSESYEPPANEPWTTGICGCTEDPDSCWLGLFCPCVLFGHNIESTREDIPWTTPCTCHAVCVEGGMALAVATALFHGVNPRIAFLIGEGLLFAWWMCGIYTGLFRQELQRKYHLQLARCILGWLSLYNSTNSSHVFQSECNMNILKSGALKSLILVDDPCDSYCNLHAVGDSALYPPGALSYGSTVNHPHSEGLTL